MTLDELFDALKEGKKIRKNGWHKEIFFYLDKERNCLLFHDKTPWIIDFCQLLNYKNFELYEEPQQVKRHVKNHREYYELLLSGKKIFHEAFDGSICYNQLLKEDLHFNDKRQFFISDHWILEEENERT